MKIFRIVKTHSKGNLKWRVDQRHSILFGLIKWWDKGAYDLCPTVYFTNWREAANHIYRAYGNKAKWDLKTD